MQVINEILKVIMIAYRTQQRFKMIEYFYYCQQSIVTMQRKYCQYFNSRPAPTAFIIRNLFGRFKKRGSGIDRPGRGAY